MHEEFEQLLEAQWEERLGEEGRQRLDVLCAAHPALAQARRTDDQLSRVLTRCGPNHAPAGLSQAVFAQLDLAANLDMPHRADVGRAMQLDFQRRTRPWTPWWPALRWSVAMLAVVAVGMEVGWLARQSIRVHPQDPATQQIAATPAETNAPPAPNSTEQAWRLAGEVKARQAAKEKKSAPRPSAPSHDKAAREVALRELAKVLPSDKKAKPAAAIPATPAAKAPVAVKPKLQVAWVSPKKEIQVARPATKSANPAATGRVLASSDSAKTQRQTPAGSAEPALAVRTLDETARLSRDRSPMVAMRILLGQPDDGRQAAPGGGSVPSEAAPATTMPGNAFAGGGATRASDAGATLKDVEIAVYTVGGEILAREPVTGHPGYWRLRCTLTPRQMQRFVRELEQAGLTPVTKGPAGAPGHESYEIIEGQRLLSPPKAAPASSEAGKKMELHLLVVQRSAANPAR